MNPANACNELFSALQNRDFRAWRGIDPACRTSAVLARYQHGEESAEVEIGSELRSARFHMLRVPGYEEPVRVIFDGESIRTIETEFPPVSGDLLQLQSSLGPPAARLDSYFDVLLIRNGEFAYPHRGITLFVNDETQELVRIALYTATSLETYLNELRLDFEPREHHDDGKAPSEPDLPFLV